MVQSLPDGKFQSILSWIRELACDERLMIILVASRLDDSLKEMLQRAMIHQSGSQDPLFESNGPLGSFSSRILLSYRLGLIDRDFERFLQTLRKLRNDAAHAAHHIDLRSPPHVDRVLDLHNLASRSPMWTTTFVPPVDPKEDPSASLFSAFTMAVFLAEFALLNTEPFSVKTLWGFHLMQVISDD
jgi:hypothetical protein